MSAASEVEVATRVVQNERSVTDAPVAQLDRASGYEPEGREFKSLRARHLSPALIRT